MGYEKRHGNVAKHGVDFAAIENFRWESALITPDVRAGERRFVALGLVRGRLHVAVYTRRGMNRRKISLRKANRREGRRYARIQRIK